MPCLGVICANGPTPEPALPIALSQAQIQSLPVSSRPLVPESCADVDHMPNNFDLT